MRIIQITPTLVYGDGVGNDVLAIHRYLNRISNITAYVYCQNFDKRIKDKRICRTSRLPRTRDRDLILYHLSTGSEFNQMIPDLKGKKIFIYHNITPPVFFDNYSPQSARLCTKGIEETKALADVPDMCIADSEYNKQDLLSYGYKCPINILPIIIPFDDYKMPFDEKMYRKYDDGKTNILFTGRIAPNKKHEDLILAFYYYQKYYNADSRLILAGKVDGMEVYYQRLQEFIRRLGVHNVEFTEHISFSEILACYKVSDMFLCMSEHEGFCIPIIEAMTFGLPIIAYDSTAVSDTLGDGGILVKEKNPIETAALINYTLTHPELIDQIKKNQKIILDRLQYEKITQRLSEIINKVIKM